MMLLILKFPLCGLQCQWSPFAESPLPKPCRRRCQVGWAPGYEWQSGLICQEPLSRDSGWKVHWICPTKCLQLSIALQGAVTPSLSILGSDGWLFWWTLLLQCLSFPLNLPHNFSSCTANSACGESDPVGKILFSTSPFWSRQKRNKLVPYPNLLQMLIVFWPSVKTVTVCLI